MQSSRQPPAWMLGAILDTSGKSAARFHHPPILQTPTALRNSGSLGENPYPQLTLHRLAAASDRLRVAEPRALPTRVPKDLDMNTADLNMAVHCGSGLP
jgi:hypothetical protein